MKKITLRKVLSGILTFCMLVSLLTCVSLLPASAATSDYMFYINGSNGDSKQVMFRNNSNYLFVSGTTYNFSARLKLESSDVTADNLFGKLFNIYYYNTSDKKTGIPTNNVVQSYDSTTLTYSVTFTVPSDCRNYANTEIRIGDYNWMGYKYKIRIADMSMIAQSGTVDFMPAITEANSKVANSVSADNKYVRYNSSSSVQILSKADTFPEIVPEEPEPEPEIVSDLVEFYALANNYARMEYLKGWYTFAAGNYRFELDCKIFSGTPTIRIGMDSKYGTDNPSLLNYKAEYDKANCKYVITFSLAQSKGCNLNIDVGNYGTDGLFGCANPTLYLLDEEGNPTGENLINTFNSEYYTTSTDNSEKKDKWRTAGMSGNFTCTSPIPDGYFEPVFIPFCGGDTNEDGAVDLRDLVRYKKIMAGILTTELSLDANQDDKVDAIDLSLMRQILLNTGKSSMLYNTYYKLNYTKSLNISYIGGSVTGAVGASTDENGWAFLVTKYLKQKYPNANITESNMGVGGTGSYLGMARFNNNIIENKPDLLFIEFAINDRYNDIPEEQTKQNIEYMINSVYKSNPYADIVFVLITDKNVIGTEFESLKTIKSVAEYYGLPTVDVGQAMWKELNGSIDNWDEYYSDGVHPSDAGHKVYADTVFEKMEEIMINGGKFKFKLPEETMCENGFTNVKLLTRDTFGPFKWGTLDDTVYGAAWWFDNDIYEKSGCPLRTSYARCFSKILPKYIYPKYDGATLEFTVTGNNIGIIGTIKEGQSITVTLDGNETKTINGTSNVAMTEYPLWNSLENTEHTVKIVANGDGPYIALAAVVVGN